MSIIKSELMVKNMLLKNRLIMPPMATRSAGTDGKITEDILNYYDEKSKGGYFSLIITEHSFVDIKGRADEHQISIASDDDIDGLSKLTEIIRRNGSYSAAQINHAGARGLFGEKKLSPSAINSVDEISKGKSWVSEKEMSRDEISELINRFAESALRAKKAGYDAVEIHSAHGYLLNQFYSPLTNHRTDEYGGDINGRIKIHLEIIDAIRNVVGKDYPVMIRLGAYDYLDGGCGAEDAVLAAVAFEKAGVDIIDISGGLCGYTINGREKEQGYFSEVSEVVRKAVSIPVILTGGITDINAAEKLLTDKKADLIGVGRAVLKDSKWAEKALKTI